MKDLPPWTFVHGVLEGASKGAVEDMLLALPEGADGRWDPDVGAVVVWVHGGADLANQALHVLSRSGLVEGGPGTEEAILKYLPRSAKRKAHWDVLGDDEAICTTCSWTVEASSFAELNAEIRRHTNDVHGGQESWSSKRHRRNSSA